MGNYTDPDYELYGGDCPRCFDPGHTPKFVHVHFSGIHRCDPDWNPEEFPIPEDWLLEQSLAQPCAWDKTVGNWRCVYNAGSLPGPSSFLQLSLFGILIFSKAFQPGCTTWFASRLTCADGFAAEGGYGKVIWVPEGSPDLSIHEIMSLVGIEPEYATMFEFWPTDDSHVVCKFCRVRDSTNIKVKVETT